MQPDRFEEMARAMQGHAGERAGQVAGAADTAGVLLESAGMGASEAYSNLTLPQRPIDAILAGAPQDNSGDDLVRAMQAENVTGPGFGASPTLAMSPQELGIGPSPEWMAQDDARLAEIDGLRNERVFQAAMRRAAYKLKMEEHSDEFSDPAVQADARRQRDEWIRAKNGS